MAGTRGLRRRGVAVLTGVILAASGLMSAAHPAAGSVAAAAPRGSVWYDAVAATGTDDAYVQGFDGRGQTVVVDDTGGDMTHPVIAGRVRGEACTSVESSCPGGTTTASGPGAASLCDVETQGCQHGTEVTGAAVGDGAVLAGVAPGATVQESAVGAVRTGSDCTVDDPSVRCATHTVADEPPGLATDLALVRTTHAAALSMSWGDTPHWQLCDGPLAGPLLAVRAAGAAPVVGVGNDGSFGVDYPACLPGAVRVGGLGPDGQVAGFSNRGPLVDFYAPSTDLVLPTNAPDGYSLGFGTSFGTPMVAAAFAIARQARPSASVDLLLGALRATGGRVVDPSTGQRTPTLDVGAAVRLLRHSGPLAVPADDTYTFDGPAAHTLPLLGNDTTTDGRRPRFVDVSDAPAHGRLVCRSTGACTYTPNPGWIGTDVFLYRVATGEGPATTGKVMVTTTATVSCTAATLTASIAGQPAFTVTVDAHANVGRFTPGGSAATVVTAAGAPIADAVATVDGVGRNWDGAGWLADDCARTPDVTVWRRAPDGLGTTFGVGGVRVELATTVRASLGRTGPVGVLSRRTYLHNDTDAVQHPSHVDVVHATHLDGVVGQGVIAPSRFSTVLTEPVAVSPLSDGTSEQTILGIGGYYQVACPGGTLVHWGWDRGQSEAALPRPDAYPDALPWASADEGDLWLSHRVDDCVAPHSTETWIENVAVAPHDAGAPFAGVVRPYLLRAGVPATFDASSSVAVDGRRIVEYRWDLGDGSPPVVTTEPKVTLTASRGTPNGSSAGVTVVDDQGGTDYRGIGSFSEDQAYVTSVLPGAVRGRLAGRDGDAACAYLDNGRPGARVAPVVRGAFGFRNLAPGVHALGLGPCPTPRGSHPPRSAGTVTVRAGAVTPWSGRAS